MSTEGRGYSLCAAQLCTNNSRNKNLAYFGFPKDRSRAEIWAKAAGRKDLLHKNITYYKLCEDHFERKWIYCWASGLRRLRLCKDAVPTIFPYPKRTEGPSQKNIVKSDSSAVSVELLTENEPSNLEKHLDEPSWRKRKGIIAYRINKVPKLTTESNLTIAAPSEPSTSASTRPLNELESVYLKEEPSSEGVQEEFEPVVNIDSDDFYTGDTFVEPLLYSGTDDLDDTSKLDYIEQIVESKSDLVTLFHNLSQLAKRLDPLDQALFQSKVSNTVFQMKILQLRGTSC